MGAVVLAPFVKPAPNQPLIVVESAQFGFLPTNYSACRKIILHIRGTDQWGKVHEHQVPLVNNWGNADV